MLEEALRDPNKNPAEVAQAMLSFVRSDLPNGGTSSEERFFALFSLLCARVFGALQDEKGEFQHEAGGWLSTQNRWRPPASSFQQQPHTMYGGASRTVAGNRASLSIDADPVVRLLGPSPPSRTSSSSSSSSGQDKENHLRSLIEAVTEEAESRPGVLYPFPFHALPATIQEQFLLVLEAAVMNASQNPALGHPHVSNVGYNHHQQQTQRATTMSHNSEKLFGKLLRVRPEGQNQVRAYQQKKLQQKDMNQPMQLSPGLSTPPPLVTTSPKASTPTNNNNNNNNNTQEQKEKTPNLILSMLEYYMFLFLRYPLASPTIQKTPSQARIGGYQVSGPMNYNVNYNTGRTEPAYGERIYFNLFCRYLKHFLPHSQEFEPDFRSMGSEFFLRVLISFWLESKGSVPTTSKALQSIQDRFQRSGIQHAPSVDLNMSYDLAYCKYEPPPTMAQKCLRSLVIHLITDPAIYRAVKDTGSRKTCLNPGMAALQQPFYNFVRTTLRHASIHSQGSVFYTAMNAWLIWLEPWNVQHAKKKDFAQNATQLISSISGSNTQSTSAPGLTIPSSDRKSMYDKSWEPYLAANLFLYTVPLAIFLRRARELDFSPREFNRSMVVVKRVFRVYTPEVISTLNMLTEAIQQPSAPTTQLSQMAIHHMENLTDHAPSPTQGNLAISSCQVDMQGLLEEVYMQHVKRVKDLGAIDKFAAFLEGLFGGGVVSGEEKAIHFLVERAKVIVGLPIDFEMFPGDALKEKTEGSNSDASQSSSALRTADGLLTKQGREQLLSGRYKCSPTEIKYIGDNMGARVKSHEIGWLVPWTIELSKWVNQKCGYSTTEQANGKDTGSYKESDGFLKRLREQKATAHFRFNFRFLADYRNLLFIFLTGWLIKKWLFSY